MSPEEGRRANAPLSTYRVQLHAGFGFDALREQVDYLADLGISHAYLSPILQAVPGSMHGYDVIDHSRINEELGGGLAFQQLRLALEQRGMSSVIDIVPNHVAVPVPITLSEPLWSVLREGPGSRYAAWFDVDWGAQDRAILMPVLGKRIGTAVRDGEIRVDRSGPQPVLRYFDHVYPIRSGTEDLPLDELLDRQFYRLAYWRVADEELNYRRFFDIDTLAGLRVEDDAVFAESHALIVAVVNDGGASGLRIDHPDGLADPAGYLRRLSAATGNTWVVVEKILEGDEELPEDWDCAGTTGYDAMLRIGGLFLDPSGEAPLTRLYAEVVGEEVPFEAVVEQAKRDVVEGSLYAEVARLVELAWALCQDHLMLRDHTRRGLRESLVELLVAFPVYRAYVAAGKEPPPASEHTLEQAADAARDRLPEERHDTLDLVRDLALGRISGGLGLGDPRLEEFVVRFQQTCGPVMAKGVEDTAFYRWFRLTSLNEVGGLPSRFGVSVEEFHRWCVHRQQRWPLAMTGLSTHDTKRSEDVRARIGVLSEMPSAWSGLLTEWRAATAETRPDRLDANTEYLLWQTLAGTWPISADRLVAYLEKATREAKLHTSWVDPDPAYDGAVRSFAESVVDNPEIVSALEAFLDRTAAAARAGILGQKLLALTLPGVPDVYQGTELLDLSLVDPDNRRPVDYARRRTLLAGLDPSADLSVDEEKLLVTSRALRLRRTHPEWFGAQATYEPLDAGSPYAVAFARTGRAVTVATRLASALERDGGWGDATLTLPPLPPTAHGWTDLLSATTWPGRKVLLSELLARRPVALLVAAEAG